VIQPLLEDTATILLALTNYRRSKGVAQQLGDTRDKLGEVGNSIENFVTHYALVAPRLRGDLPDGFTDRIAECRQQMLNSKANFPASPYQVTALNRVLSDITRLDKELLALWMRYVERIVRPKVELYGLLAELDEIRRNQTTLQQRFAALQRCANSLPDSPEQVESLDRQLASVTHLLTSVEGITPVIQGFLARVHQGTFTIADLNDEILAWCRVNDRGRSFKIKA
jgi:hypothetical protein